MVSREDALDFQKSGCLLIVTPLAVTEGANASEFGLLQLISLSFTSFIDTIAMKPNSPRLPSHVVGVSRKAFTPFHLRKGFVETQEQASPWWPRGCRVVVVVPGCLRCLTARCSCQPAQETPFQKDADGKPCSASDSVPQPSHITTPREGEIMLTYLIL